jgi:hypothetical protein
MRRSASATSQAVFHLAYIKPILYLALAMASMLLIAPATAGAQTDAIRIMAGRVLDEATNRGVRTDRDGGVYRNDDIYRRDGNINRRDRNTAWERERIARERWCRQHPNDRRCDGWLRDRRGNNANWCWDRDRNGRCDTAARNNGRGRGSWRDDDGGWVPPGQRKKRGW